MAARAQTVTILFTDLVSSTELLQRAGDERAQRIFKAHHRLLSEAVQAHGGHEVKWLGDGLMVAFDSARDAAQCAIAMQQASRRPAAGERLQIRAGLHVGEAFKDESDYFGTSVVIARRLCDKADAGQIYASDLVVRLLDGRHEITFEDLGALTLKGIETPVHAHEVRYEHDPLAMLTVTPFVGRDDVMAELSTKLEEARAGKGSLVMLVGEPGIGKTRTASEFCEQARQSGATVLWGRCYDGEWAAPFSPFMEAIRAYANDAPMDDLREKLGADAGVLARLVPALRERLPDIAEPPAIPAEGERYRLLEAAGDFFGRLAGARRLVLMLDDLHWADKGTIAMLRQVARLAPQQRLLIIGAYRDIELDRAHPLADALHTLRRETNYERIVLKGLGAADVGALLNLVAEQDVPDTFVRAIGDETGGNPFFIREVMLHLVEEKKIVQEDGRWVAAAAIADMRIPEGVREVIGRRLSRVSDGCGRMLTVASALTAGFSWEVMSALVDLGEASLLDAVDEALAAQLIVEGERGRYDFTHALIRHTLYAQLSTPRRRILHREIAEALERVHTLEAEPHVSELAHHFFEATTPGRNDERAADYCRRAADRAAAVAAFEDAVSLIEKALSVCSERAAPRARLLERCADLVYMSGRDWDRGTAALEDALKIYQDTGESARIPHVHSKLGRALSAMHPRRDIPRATEHYNAAVEMLRRGARDVVFGYAKVGVANAALFNVDTPAGVEASAEAMQIAEELGHESLWANAATLHGFHLVNAGRPQAGVDTIERAWTVADRLNHAPAAFLSAWHGGHVLARLAPDPSHAIAMVERELLTRRTEQAALQQQMLKGVLIDARLVSGDTDAACALDAETGGQGQSFLSADAFGGRLDEARRRTTGWLENARRDRNNWNSWMYMSHLAAILLRQRDLIGAEALLIEAMAVVTNGRNLAGELLLRAQMIRLRTAAGSAAECDEDAARIQEIVAGNDGWRGAAAYADVARAVIAAACGDAERAAAVFRAALGAYADYGLQPDADDTRQMAAGLLGAHLAP